MLQTWRSSCESRQRTVVAAVPTLLPRVRERLCIVVPKDSSLPGRILRRQDRSKPITPRYADGYRPEPISVSAGTSEQTSTRTSSWLRRWPTIPRLSQAGSLSIFPMRLAPSRLIVRTAVDPCAESRQRDGSRPPVLPPERRHVAILLSGHRCVLLFAGALRRWPSNGRFSSATCSNSKPVGYRESCRRMGALGADAGRRSGRGALFVHDSAAEWRMSPSGWAACGRPGTISGRAPNATDAGRPFSAGRFGTRNRRPSPGSSAIA